MRRVTDFVHRGCGCVLAAAWLSGGAAWAQDDAPPEGVPPEMAERIRAALPERAPAAPAQPRELLVFSRTEGFVHQCIPAGNLALRLMGETTGAYQADIREDMEAFDWENLQGYDAVLFNNTTQLAFADPAHREALLRFVREGGGLAGIHAATDNFYSFDEAAALIGGQFDGHPWQAGGTWRIRVEEPAHPCNEGFAQEVFDITDEIYQIKGPYARSTHRVLLSLDMTYEPNRIGGRADGDNPVSWVRRAGGGRIFYCSLGHNHHVYWDPAVLRHYLAGIQYVLGDLDVPDAPSLPAPGGGAAQP
jgi:uncharacterized protein